ncbi:MAG: winged helix-turn-helix domain-containing protein [Chloroflexi bacterium]|nr:winged helix-turn-helix domain-containing protein [Chloroflexota bacterium]
MTTLKYFITSKAKRNVLHLFMLDPGKPHYTREVARLTGEPLNAVRRELGYLEKAGLLSSRAQGNLKYYEVVKSFPLLVQWRKIILESDAAPPPSTVIAPPVLVIASEATKLSPGTKHTIAINESFKHAPLEDGDKPIIPGARVIPNHEPLPAPDVIALPSPAIAGDAVADAMAKSEAAEQSPEPKPGTILTIQSVVNHLSDQWKDVNTINLALVHGEAARSERIPENGIDLLVVGDINKDTLLELIANFEDTTGISVNLTSMTRSDFDYRNARGDSLVRKVWGEKKLVVKGRQ